MIETIHEGHGGEISEKPDVTSNEQINTDSSKAKSNIIVVLPGDYPKTKLPHPSLFGKDRNSREEEKEHVYPWFSSNKWFCGLPYGGHIIQSDNVKTKYDVFVPRYDDIDMGSFEVTIDYFLRCLSNFESYLR